MFRRVRSGFGFFRFREVRFGMVGEWFRGSRVGCCYGNFVLVLVGVEGGGSWGVLGRGSLFFFRVFWSFVENLFRFLFRRSSSLGLG